MAPGYTITTETRGDVEIFILREADIASAAIAPACGNNCSMLQVDAPVLKLGAFEEFRTRPTSYGIPILFPFPKRLRDVEPYTCPTDGVNLHARGIESNLIVLQPRETRHFLVSIATHRAGS
jgi:hypothetical protein